MSARKATWGERPALDDDEAFGALMVLEHVSDLFTISGRDTFTREEVLVVLNLVKTDRQIFAPEAVVAYEIASAEAAEEI